MSRHSGQLSSNQRSNKRMLTEQILTLSIMMLTLSPSGDNVSRQASFLARTMEIRFLKSQDVAAYGDLWLRALRESPTAFNSSYEQEACLHLTDFAARLRPHDDSASNIFGAFGVSDQLIGMVGFSCESRPKRAHIGSLYTTNHWGSTAFEGGVASPA